MARSVRGGNVRCNGLRIGLWNGLGKRGDMRWFRRSPAEKSGQVDQARQGALLQEIRQRFGPAATVPARDQVAALTPLLDGDEGRPVAVRIIHDVAEEACAAMLAQVAEVNRRTGQRYALDGRNYRALWQQTGQQLRSPLFGLPSGFHPYVHLAAALAVVATDAKRCVRIADPAALAARVLEVLDLTTAGWEFGGVPVDVDAADLVNRLIAAAGQIRSASPDEPPPLPPAIREGMRRNNTTEVFDRAGGAAVGGINVGAQMRQAFLT
jgi:hypothetical protein